ncbi:MAG: glycoside hydrolase family 127 protein [Armatimonadetes bacterium]|nr:glycoside hydrolase family 127 protein [Armatimonadota bacterium]
MPACDTPRELHLDLAGLVGRRVEANLEQWLLPAPLANPALTGMFQRRDRQPPPDLVDWAGEFAGKYLLSAILARRLTRDPRLDTTVRRVLDDVLKGQAEDGYLGPWPQDQRLLGHWDLWGHYHLMIALLMWHRETGSAPALEAARRIGDLICRTYLDTGRRVLQAGSHEMNMAVIHSLARLHRVTGEERYLRQCRAIQSDWEDAGDYFRAGLAGTPFYRCPRPRWESLHDLEGLPELYLATGNDDYRRSFINLWNSIRDFDVHNAGSFSSGEQAIGDPYRPGAIETCCTVAWVALSVDMLHLTGDPRVADELERSTLNAVLGAQHPSGRWWTYNTPMDGVRRSSAHEIVFQARAGQPELNCCSVNGPRALAEISNWAVLEDADGLLVNYYGPSAIILRHAGVAVKLTQETDYPVGGQITLRVEPEQPVELDLRLRIPGWAAGATVELDGKPVPGVQPGRYLTLARRWSKGDTVRLSFPLELRAEPGESSCRGQVSVFRGPLLLAYDAARNGFDEADLPKLDPTALSGAARPGGEGVLDPWLTVTTPGERPVVLCDYASAGASGSAYRSWLPATRVGPGVFRAQHPADGAKLPPGRILFRWAPPQLPQKVDYAQTLEVRRAGGEVVVTEHPAPPYQAAELPAGRYEWRVVRRNDAGERAIEGGWQALEVDPAAPPAVFAEPEELRLDEHGVATASSLDGTAQPSFGELIEARNLAPAEDRHGNPQGAVAFNGTDSRASYRLAWFPTEDCSVAVWAWLDSYPEGRIAQVFSAWCNGGDDPLRVTIDGRQVFARHEGGGFAGTPGTPLELHRWTHLAAVKQGSRLTLYVDGKPAGACDVSAAPSGSTRISLGGNPLYGGNEYLHGRLDEFTFWARALTGEEVREASAR